MNPDAAHRPHGGAAENLATFLMADGCEWLTGETIASTAAAISPAARARVLHAAGQAQRRRLGKMRTMIKAQNDKTAPDALPDVPFFSC